MARKGGKDFLETSVRASVRLCECASARAWVCVSASVRLHERASARACVYASVRLRESASGRARGAMPRFTLTLVGRWQHTAINSSRQRLDVR